MNKKNKKIIKVTNISLLFRSFCRALTICQFVNIIIIYIYIYVYMFIYIIYIYHKFDGDTW